MVDIDVSCFPATVHALRRIIAMPSLSLSAMLLASCMGPTSDPATLHAIRHEARILIARHPATEPTMLAPERWPPAIAALEPAMVIVSSSNVAILMKPFFDGGWGYDVPRDEHDLPIPRFCYVERFPGVFWHDPC